MVHGDQFDVLMRKDRKWIMHIGDTLYDSMIQFNMMFNKVRRLFGLKYWSLSKMVESKCQTGCKIYQSL